MIEPGVITAKAEVAEDCMVVPAHALTESNVISVQATSVIEAEPSIITVTAEVAEDCIIVPAYALADSGSIMVRATSAVEVTHTYTSLELFPAYLTPTALPQSLVAPSGAAFDSIELDGIPYSEVSNEYGTTVNIGG